LGSMPPVANPAEGNTPVNPGGGEGEGTTFVELEDTPAMMANKVLWALAAAAEVCTEEGA